MASARQSLYVRASVLLCLLTLCGCAVRNGASRATVPELASIPWEDRSHFRQGLIASEQAALDSLPGAPIYHLNLIITNDLTQVTGQASVRYTNQEVEPLKDICLRLFANGQGGKLTLSETKIDGEDVAVALETGGTVARLSLKAPLVPGQSITITTRFDLQVPTTADPSAYALLGLREGVLTLDACYPLIPAYDAEGWALEVPPDYGDKLYADASFYLVRVTASKELVLVATGVQTAHQIRGGQQTALFAAGPVREFYLAGAEELEALSQKVGETTVHSYAPKSDAARARLALQQAVAALESMSARLGTYPYTEFDIVRAPMGALGVEYPGVTSIATALYDPAATIRGAPSQVVLESAVVHEVAHQWFYNLVGNDQINEPWLDEALAQYMTERYYLDQYGPNGARAFHESLVARWDRVEQADIPIGRPVAGYTGAEYGAIVYGRGPLFITALAEEMGQEKLNLFLREYCTSHKWGIGTGSAFRQQAQDVCQCALAPLFEAWVWEPKP